MSKLKDIVETIKDLEQEKKNLLVEIYQLEEMADAKATALESEVAALKDEVIALKNLMDKSENGVGQRSKITTTTKRSDTFYTK